MLFSKVYSEYEDKCINTFFEINNFSKKNGCNIIENRFLNALAPFDYDDIDVGDTDIDNDIAYHMHNPIISENHMSVKTESIYDIIELKIEAQKNIDMYRPDFIINNKYIIEIDGHDFHEKTKEQVRKDKQRERYLQSKGYIVIRFTGSEVYNNNHKCWYELLQIIYTSEGKNNG